MFEYKDATTFEMAIHKCNVLKPNKMQCDRKVAKIVKTDKLPENLVNLENNKIYLCQGHFNGLVGNLQSENKPVIVNEK